MGTFDNGDEQKIKKTLWQNAIGISLRTVYSKKCMDKQGTLRKIKMTVVRKCAHDKRKPKLKLILYIGHKIQRKCFLSVEIL